MLLFPCLHPVEVAGAVTEFWQDRSRYGGVRTLGVVLDEWLLVGEAYVGGEHSVGLTVDLLDGAGTERATHPADFQLQAARS